MKASLQVELKPFMTPNFVLVSGKTSENGHTTSVAIGELDSLTLERLCDEFRAEVFKKAGVPFPPAAKPAVRCIDCDKLLKD
jgi:hypothetical protein